MTKEELMKEAEEYAKNNAYRYANDFITCLETYFAGAEPREKIIAKLEEQNKNQEESLRITLLEEERKANRIKDLEKENAEIKAKYLHLTDEGTSWAHLKNLEDENKRLLQSCEGAAMMYKDLCKAREIIRSLLTYCRNYPQQVLEKIQQAEQFLREEENTKAPEAVDEIEKLKTLIRKMKRCQNCDKFDYTECKCKVGWCNNFEKWALKEVVFVDLKELDNDSE